MRNARVCLAQWFLVSALWSSSVGSQAAVPSPALAPVHAMQTLTADWYIDNQATGDNSGTSWQNAWRSLSSINWSLVNPGDTIYVSGGPGGKTYDEGIEYTRSGSSGLPITIDSGANSPYPDGHNGEVVIDGESYCIRANGDYNILRNLICQNATMSGFRIQGTGSVVEGCSVRNTYEQGIHVHYCTDCVVRGNRVTTHDDIAQQTDGIAVYDSSGTVIEGNWIKITNQNNCTSCHNDGIQAYFSTTAYRNITVRHNYVENTKVQLANAQGIYLENLHGDVKVIGNVVLVPDGNQAVVSGYGSDFRSYIVANTIKCGGYRCLWVKNNPDPVIKNNLVWQTASHQTIQLENWAGSPANIDNNLWYAPSSSAPFGGNGGSSWSTWRSMGFDSHGIFGQDPSLDSCLRPDELADPSVNSGAVLPDEFKNGLSLSLCGQNGPNSFLPAVLVDRSLQSAGWDLGAYEFSPATTTFVDVPLDHPYHDEIEWLYDNGYTAGCSTNPLMYCPEATMNRAESAVFVERGIHSASYVPPTPSSQVFADMPLDSWAASWVNGLWQDQYTAGCGINPLVYCPWQGHTRAEGSVFYLRMLHGAEYEPPQPSEQTFADVPLEAWYAKWAQEAYDAGLIMACESTPEMRFCPDAPLSRGLAASMMFQAKSGPGRTYYVSPLGSDSFPGTEAQPWRTIQKAANTLVAGDTVYIRAGTYSEQVIPQASGSASGGYITYAAYPGETATMEGKDLSLGTWDGLFHIKGSYVGGVYVRRSYIRVSRLRVVNAKGGADSYGGYDVHGIRVDNSDNIIIVNNSTYNTRSSGIGIWNSTNVIVDGNDIGLACNLGGPNNEPGAEENISIDGSSYVEVRNNHVHDGAPIPTGWSGGEGINVKNGSHHIKIFHNVVHLKPVDGSAPTRLAFGIDAWNSTVSTHDIEIFGNVAYDSHYGFIVSSEQGGTVENVNVYNNIAYNINGAGFSIPWWSGTQDGLKRNIQFINNTSYHNGYGFWNQSPLNENVIVRNNIFSQNDTNVSIASGAVAQTTVDYNLFYGTGGTYGSYIVVGDPRFVDPAAADFHLQSGSLAIDAGSALGVPSSDYDGTPRPQGAGFDIGAFEYKVQ